MNTITILIMITTGGYGGALQPPSFQEFTDEAACKFAVEQIQKKHPAADVFCVPKASPTK
jgi:hypothetical protein